MCIVISIFHHHTSSRLLLSGDANPSGRLTQTVYEGAWNGVRSIAEMGLRDAGGITYMHYTGDPLYRFGFGMYGNWIKLSTSFWGHFSRIYQLNAATHVSRDMCY